jgi:hypothetical protein
VNLTEIALALLPLIAPAATQPPDAEDIARAAVQAVILDEEAPITGDLIGDVALILVWAKNESMFRVHGPDGACLSGDGGKARGHLQLHDVGPVFACSVLEATRIWLQRAHESLRICRHNAPDERLAGLASGRCDRGRVLSRERVQAARAALGKVEGAQ